MHWFATLRTPPLFLDAVNAAHAAARHKHVRSYNDVVAHMRARANSLARMAVKMMTVSATRVPLPVIRAPAQLRPVPRLRAQQFAYAGILFRVLRT